MPSLTARRALLPALALTLLVLPGCMFAVGTKGWHPDEDGDSNSHWAWDSSWDGEWQDDDDLSDRIEALEHRIAELEHEVMLHQQQPDHGPTMPSAH